MFGSKKQKKVVEVKVTSRNIIGLGTKIVGDIISEGDFRIEGVLEGSLKTDGKVIIGKEGFIKGKIECSNADVEGKFSGEFIVNNVLTVKSTANITGDITVGQISTEPGASLNTNCHMKGSVKELKKDDEKEDKQITA
ncbi:MAG: polymer-forming cytoskeletal protein [Tenacibaculum sp.]|nr:polymer-forming cytoskeletal protein [Tenacibaculum sp.]